MAKKTHKKKAAKSASTALAVRKAPKAAPAKEVVISGLPAVPVGQLGELATVGALGLAELKLTPEEDKILSEEVDPSLIQFKPAKRDGPATIPYLPHIVYTRWMNRAFGRTGWAIVPTAAPKKVDSLILVPYLLYIHGIPVAAATGEQDFIESNKQQTYGDVIESTVASALRRCCKRLGIGLEMWDKEWLKQNAKAIGKKAERKDEVRDGEWVEDPNVYTHTVSSQLESPVITPQQLGRIAQIVERTQRNPAEVTLYLKKNFNVPRAAKLLQKDYAKVCRDLEAKGDLPLPGDGHQ